MVRMLKWTALLLTVVAWPAAVQAGYPSAVVGFNGPPIDDPATSQEMFRDPLLSPSTAAYMVNTTGVHWAYRASGLQSEGDAALDVSFQWVSTTDPYQWARITTVDGPGYPNPSLDTRGIVRFDIQNVGDFTGEGGKIGLCIGIRETGADLPQLADGGSTGAIEWVGVSTATSVIDCGTDGCQTPVAGDDYASSNGERTWISWGANRTLDSLAGLAGDDAAQAGYVASTNGARVPIPAIEIGVIPMAVHVEWDLLNKKVKVGEGSWTDCGIAAFTGDGVLNAANNRGTLEHLAITKGTNDTGYQIHFGIDQLQFEATVHDPVLPPVVQSPVFDTDTEVLVTCMTDATSAKLIINGTTNGTPVTPDSGTHVATFSGLSLTAGDSLTATQVAYGEKSDPSAPVIVVFAGQLLAEGFDDYADQADLNTMWLNSPTSPTPPEAKLALTTGAAASCNNYVMENSPVNSTAARLYRYIGDINGTDEEPLWVTWWFKELADNTNARMRMELARFSNAQWNDGARANGTTGFAFSNGVGTAGYNAQYTICLKTADPQTAGTNGFESDYYGYQYALTGMTRTSGVWHKMQVEVRSTVMNYYIDNVLRNPAQWPTGVPRPDLGSYQFIILGTGNSTNGPTYLWDSISVTMGTTPLPFPDTIPPDPPTIPSAILPNATTVTVANISTNATEVAIYADGGETPVGDVTTTGFVATTQVIPVSPALLAGQVVTARQMVGGMWSCASLPKVVGAVPAAPVVSPPLEAGSTTVHVTSIDPSATLVTVYAGTASIGSANPGGATVYDVPVTALVALDMISVTASNLSGESVHSTAYEVGRGNGKVLISLGLRETGGSGPLGANGGTSGGIEWLGAPPGTGAPQGKVVRPSNSWQTITFTPGTDPVRGFAGACNGVLDGTWGVLEHIAVATTNGLPRSTGTYRVYVDNIRNIGEGTGLLTDFESYTVGTQVMFRDPRFSGSTSGNLRTTPNTSTLSSAQNSPSLPGKSVFLSWYFVDSGPSRWVRLTTNNAANLPNPAVNITKPISIDILLIETVPPAAPTVDSPLVEGDTSVQVSGIESNATQVMVYVDGVQKGSVNPAGTNGISVPLDAGVSLVHRQSITARQVNPNGTSVLSGAKEVGKGNGPIMLGAGLRETGDTGAIGDPGSGTGTIEWVNVTTNGAHEKFGVPVSPSNSWQTITFSAANGVTRFTGDGVLSSANGMGVFEHLAIWVDSVSADRSTGPYELYIDNVYNVGAGPGGSDVLITDFEGFPLGGEAMFQEPTYSGSTSGNLGVAPSASETTTAYANGGTQSQMLTWFWKDTTTGRWVRDVTSGVTNKPNPIVNLNYPIRMDILLRAGGVELPNFLSTADSVGTRCNLALTASGKSEPRNITGKRLLFHFDNPPPALNPVVSKATTANPTFTTVGAPAANCTVAENDLDCTFSPDLANATTYRFDFTNIAVGNPTFDVRVLVGDANSDAVTNGTDRAVVIGVWTGSGHTCATDLDQSGATNGTDRAVVIGSWTSGSNTAP